MNDTNRTELISTLEQLQKRIADFNNELKQMRQEGRDEVMMRIERDLFRDENGIWTNVTIPDYVWKEFKKDQKEY